MKSSILLHHNYDVNLKNNKIVMTNLKDTAVPLIIYNKNKFNTKEYYFSYELDSNDEISHFVDIKSYNYEVIGPNGFGRKFKGSTPPELEVILSNSVSKNEVDIILVNISESILNINFKNQYDGDKKDFNLEAALGEKINISLDKTRGWYDLKIKSNTNTWHFVGRIESRKAVKNIN